MKSLYRNCFCIFYTFFILLSVCISVCSADETRRQGKFDITGLVQYMGGDTTHSTAGSVEFDAFAAFGAGFGYNLTERININGDVYLSAVDITARSGGLRAKGDATVYGVNINADWNILKNRITPLVCGGMGFLHFSGDIESEGFSETDFAYNLGAGIRWDINETLFLKGIYRATWTKLEDADDTMLFDGPSISFGATF